jgi:two-component system, NarL family, response regulator NreC
MGGTQGDKEKIGVILVDDHAVVRTGLRLLLEAEPDLAVLGEAATAADAIERVGELTPDVLLLDITMPGGGGIGALERLRKASPETRVLMLTMHDDPEYLRVALVSGAAGFILKNAAGAELLSAIRTVHQGRTYVDPTLAGAALRGILAAAERAGAGENPTDRLSRREIEVLRQLALGYTNKEIANRLDLSVKSVETYRARVSEKLGLSGRAELFRYALENGMILPDKAPAQS